MRVAILTLAPATNYGGILQAWALRSLLADMGHEATVVSLRLRPAVALRYGVGNFLIRHHLHPTKRYYVPSHSEALRTTAELRRFIAEQVAPATPLLPRALQRAGYEAFVIGSDQVWNPDYTRPYGAENFFGDFLPESDRRPRIVYAASMGGDKWRFTPAESEKIGALLSRCKAVSVREQGVCKVLGERFGVASEWVADPVMEIGRHRLLQVAGCELSEEHTFAYLLDPTELKNAIVQQVAEGQKVKKITSPKPHEVIPSVEEWVAGFAGARRVVTDSFHGVVMSLVLGKEFVAVGNAARGMARFTSLMSAFGVGERLIDEQCADATALFSKPIDWQGVEDTMVALRSRSMEFLAKSFEK